MELRPEWASNLGLVWSTVPSHHDRYLAAKSDVAALPAEIDRVSAEHSEHARDLRVLGEVLAQTPTSKEARSEYETKMTARDRAASHLQSHKARLAQCDRTIGHFESLIEVAWRNLFESDMPPDSGAMARWVGGDQTYFLHPDGRVVTRGRYDGILISQDEQPRI